MDDDKGVIYRNQFTCIIKRVIFWKKNSFSHYKKSISNMLTVEDVALIDIKQ